MRNAGWRLADSRPVPGPALLFVISAEAVVMVLFFLFRRIGVEGVGPGLLATGLSYAAVLGLGMFILGKLRARDLGLGRGLLAPGLAFVSLVLVVALPFLLLLGNRAGTALVVPGLSQLAVATTLLSFFALREEMLYRAFLLPQVFIRSQRWGGLPSNAPLLLTLLLTQSAFALVHLTTVIANERTVSEAIRYIPAVGALGLALAVVYLRTENLVATTGVHVLVNLTPRFFHGNASVLAGAMVVIVALLLAMWHGRRYAPAAVATATFGVASPGSTAP